MNDIFPWLPSIVAALAILVLGAQAYCRGLDRTILEPPPPTRIETVVEKHIPAPAKPAAATIDGTMGLIPGDPGNRPHSAYDHEIDRAFYGWTMVGQSVGELTLTKAAVPGRHHVIEKVEASYSDRSVSGLVVVKFEDAVVGAKFIHGEGTLEFPGSGRLSPNPNETFAVSLSDAGAIGIMTVSGYTMT